MHCQRDRWTQFSSKRMSQQGRCRICVIRFATIQRVVEERERECISLAEGKHTSTRTFVCILFHRIPRGWKMQFKTAQFRLKVQAAAATFQSVVSSLWSSWGWRHPKQSGGKFFQGEKGEKNRVEKVPFVKPEVEMSCFGFVWPVDRVSAGNGSENGRGIRPPCLLSLSLSLTMFWDLVAPETIVKLGSRKMESRKYNKSSWPVGVSPGCRGLKPRERHFIFPVRSSRTLGSNPPLSLLISQLTALFPMMP